MHNFSSTTVAVASVDFAATFIREIKEKKVKRMDKGHTMFILLLRLLLHIGTRESEGGRERERAGDLGLLW